MVQTRSATSQGSLSHRAPAKDAGKATQPTSDDTALPKPLPYFRPIAAWDNAFGRLLYNMNSAGTSAEMGDVWKKIFNYQ